MEVKEESGRVVVVMRSLIVIIIMFMNSSFNERRIQRSQSCAGEVSRCPPYTAVA